MGDIKSIAMPTFLSHLSGDEVDKGGTSAPFIFLSHLSGDEERYIYKQIAFIFLSHLSGDEVL